MIIDVFLNCLLLHPVALLNSPFSFLFPKILTHSSAIAFLHLFIQRAWKGLVRVLRLLPSANLQTRAGKDNQKRNLFLRSANSVFRFVESPRMINDGLSIGSFISRRAFFFITKLNEKRKKLEQDSFYYLVFVFLLYVKKWLRVCYLLLYQQVKSWIIIFQWLRQLWKILPSISLVCKRNLEFNRN